MHYTYVPHRDPLLVTVTRSSTWILADCIYQKIARMLPVIALLTKNDINARVLDEGDADRSKLNVALRPDFQIDHRIEVHRHTRHRIDLRSTAFYCSSRGRSTYGHPEFGLLHASKLIRAATMKGPAPKRMEAKALAPIAKAAFGQTDVQTCPLCPEHKPREARGDLVEAVW